MGKLRTRYIVSVIITLIGAVLVNAVEYETFYRPEVAVLSVKKIPLNLGKWHGVDVFLPEDVYDILETRAILHRSYKFEGQSVFLSLVFYPETKVDFHAPEACLGGSGRKIQKSSKTITFENGGENVSLGINRLTYYGGLKGELVYYFYKAGTFMGKNYILLRLNLAKNKLTGHGASGSLIRISTTNKPIGDMNPEDRLKSFLEELYPYLVGYL